MLSWFGIIAVMLSLIPVVAISPILLYIGMLIGAQAFQETSRNHAPAIVLALVPHLAAWCKTLMDGALTAAGTSAAAVGFDKLGQVGVLYRGLEVLGGGAILSGLILGAIAVFVIEKKFMETSYFAPAGAVLTFFGFMHGEAVGLAVTPSIAAAYAVVAAFLYALSRMPAEMAMPVPIEKAGRRYARRIIFTFAMAEFIPAIHGLIPGKVVDARPARAGHGDTESISPPLIPAQAGIQSLHFCAGSPLSRGRADRPGLSSSRP